MTHRVQDLRRQLTHAGFFEGRVELLRQRLVSMAHDAQQHGFDSLADGYSRLASSMDTAKQNVAGIRRDISTQIDRARRR